MPAAARVDDPTSHGIPLKGAGSPNVVIGGRPAWRITDYHTCPLYDGKSPHVGGLVTVGCPKVLIDNVPAAKMGDTVSEAAGPQTKTDEQGYYEVLNVKKGKYNITIDLRKLLVMQKPR